ncbi:hypothetical protein EDD18DRAFT_1460346 [Armillaria luteobubalina]|uniref:HAM1-like N-terminal domain-containing protein n=1 Tax=Armillaria luteobubalina TaxID=153913 RepID=A0AA39QDD2_9AGAR|nr:hypothetical protein EDD18DRAFT_1460346 [Armillaria luteobubalina]
MGLCFSSCRRRRRRSKDSSGRGHQYSESEESPLLGDSIDDSGSQSTVTNAVNLANKAVEVVASLKSGKYPSQDQVDNLLRRFLQSDILRESRYTQISPQGQHIIHDVHRLCGVLLVFGAEKNGDDRLQDLLFLANTISKPVDYAVGGGETKIELDVHCKVPRSQDLGHDLNQFIEAVKSLTVLLFSSTTARIIVSNIVVFVRDIVANFADDISDAAQQVQGLAEGVGKIAESVEATVEGISNNSEADANTPVHKVAHTPTQIEVAVREVADNANAAAAFVQDAKHRDSSDAPHRHTDDSQSDSAAEGIQAILVEAHQDPRYIAALKTLLSLLEKYLSIWQELGVMLSQPSPPVFKFNSIAADTKILLERLASGKSLDPLLATMSNLVTAVTSVPGEDHTVAQLRDYFTDLRGYLVRAYSDVSYVKSSRCRTDISQMIHRGRIILKAAHRTENLLKIFIGEAQTFISALLKDHTTIRLLRAFTTLSTDLHNYLASVRASITTRGSLYWSEVMWNDIAAVAMNALLSLTRNIFRPNGAVIIPIPRVEYGDTKLDVAVDGRLMKVSLVDDAWNEARYAGVGGDPESDMPNRLTPSSISVRRWSELRLDFAAATLPENGTAITSSNKVNIHIDGVLSGARHRVVSLADLGYFFRFKSFLGYEDEGVLGLDIGFGGLGGGTIDIVLELDTQTADEDQVDFSIASVTVTLPPSLDIGVELMDSRHWILNTMLTPIALPLVKWFVRRELEKTVEQWIRSAINSLARGLHVVRDETHKDGGQSVWTAIANVISSGQLFNASAVDEPDVRTETTVSLKGVQIQRGAADDGGESQSTMTIGIASQILPCKGELQPLVSPEAMYEHVASEVSDQVAYAEERLVDAEQQVREGLSAVEELIDRAGDTLKRTESGERRIDGWRSHTFDM